RKSRDGLTKPLEPDLGQALQLDGRWGREVLVPQRARRQVPPVPALAQRDIRPRPLHRAVVKLVAVLTEHLVVRRGGGVHLERQARRDLPLVLEEEEAAIFRDAKALPVLLAAQELRDEEPVEVASEIPGEDVPVVALDALPPSAERVEREGE